MAFRPGVLVRADTLDLQDQDAPTAAQHTKQANGNGIAPHQASQYQHVQEERHSEEQTLADAWSAAGDSTGDTDTMNQHGEDGKVNGSAANGEGADGSEDTDADADDDMMDRISSSPSIDDGAFAEFPSLNTTPPARRHSTPQRRTSAFRESFNESPMPSMDSSPFVQTPQYLPLRPLGLEHVPRLGPVTADELSPSLHTPQSSPLLSTATFGTFVSATSVRQGRYEKHSGSGKLEDRSPSDGCRKKLVKRAGNPSKRPASHPEGSPAKSKNLFLPVRRNAFSNVGLAPRTSQHLEKSPSAASINSLDLQSILLPAEDPLLDSPRSSDCSWDTLSDDGSTQEDEEEDSDADDFLDSKDIDFEFVYALHTFVATVEGQANATKGDTMVLLDDSNSYWWLVRVVKDSSIGYLPAEHIETPTERLARLNKHRNIDLAQTMLGDNPEKTRNPLKKAMRRRTAKQVQFAAPTYVEASDYDYSDDEEQGVADPYAGVVQPEEHADRGQPAEVEERNAPEEANVHATRRFSGEQSGAPKTSLDNTSKTSLDSKRSSIDDPQLSPRLVDRSEAAPLKSRKGTPRNADSFLKDETIETRKISLTPGLLRDDTASKGSSTESARNESLESLVKTPSPQEERNKKEVKEKEKKKKQGMLSGLFKSKKKDKKSGSRDETAEQSDAEKGSLEMGRNASRSSPAPVSGDNSPVDRAVAAAAAAMPGSYFPAEPKSLQQMPAQKKVPPPINTGVNPSEPVREVAPKAADGGFLAELPGSEAAVEMPPGQVEDGLEPPKPEFVQDKERNGPLSPITNMLKVNTSSEPKPKKAKRSKQRVELDDFDSPASEKGVNPFIEQEERARESQDAERLSDSPVEIAPGTFMHGTESVHIPVINPDDEDSDAPPSTHQEEEGKGHNRSLSTSPSLIERPSEQHSEAETEAEPKKTPDEDEDPTPTTRSPQPTNPTAGTTTIPPSRPPPQQPQPPSRTHSTSSLSSHSTAPTASTPISSSSPHQASTTSQQEWDDTNLRAWLDAEEVKDMLRIIHHSKQDVQPVAADHPMMQGLYGEQRKGVQGMMGELDGLLGGWLERKGIVFA